MSITIFLADDHAVLRDAMRVMLETQLDCQVIGDAANGREAVEKITQRCPDIAILDITMPELNGIEVTRQISEICPETRVIILSIHDTREHISHALQAGVQGYLLKESAGDEVIEAINTIQQGHYYLNKSISDKVIVGYKQLGQIDEAISPLESLSPREKEILQLTVEGKSNIEISKTLSLSPKSVATYRTRLMEKLDIHDLPSLVKFAIRHGLTSL